MARKPTGNPNGRPPKEIDAEQFEKLCSMQCTLDEISGWFKCSKDTISAWCKRTYGEGFSDVYKKFSQDGKISLRRYQFELAKHNASMAIFLGKQYLGQKEQVETYEAQREAIEKLEKMEIKFVDGSVKDDTES